MIKLVKKNRKRIRTVHIYSVYVKRFKAGLSIVYYKAVFGVVTQRSSPLGEERCVTTLKTAVWQSR